MNYFEKKIGKSIYDNEWENTIKYFYYDNLIVFDIINLGGKCN